MTQITETFYVLSNALLLPVMFLLLLSLLRVLIQCGRCLQEFLGRQQSAAYRGTLETAIRDAASTWPEPSKTGESQPWIRELTSARDDLPQIAYLIEQAELQWQSKLDRLRSIAKIGPALGLMGTLIPLGPALVGLAVGDIQTMSDNLVVAFSTTVLGLFIGLVAGQLVSIKKHWYQSDAALLNFAAERWTTGEVTYV